LLASLSGHTRFFPFLPSWCRRDIVCVPKHFPWFSTHFFLCLLLLLLPFFLHSVTPAIECSLSDLRFAHLIGGGKRFVFFFFSCYSRVEWCFFDGAPPLPFATRGDLSLRFVLLRPLRIYQSISLFPCLSGLRLPGTFKKISFFISPPVEGLPLILFGLCLVSVKLSSASSCPLPHLRF